MGIKKAKPESKGAVFYEYSILSIIVSLGFALRFFHLQFYPFPNSTDSVAYSYAALLYSRGEWLSRNATWKGSLFVLLISLFFKIFGPNFLASRLVSLLFGGLLPIIVYFLGSELFNRKTGLLGAFIVSINPLLILYSCLTFREILFSFTWLFFIYFALRGFRGNTFYSIASGIFFAFSSMTIEIGIFAGLGCVFYFIIRKALKNRDSVCECRNLDVFFCSGFLTLVPLLIRDYLVRGNPLTNWTAQEWLTQYVWFTTPVQIYIGLIALSIPYTILSRTFLRHIRRPSIDRYSNLIIAFLIGSVMLAVVLVVGFLSGLFSGGLAALAARCVVGFVKFAEHLAWPESFGFFLIVFSIFGIAYALKTSSESFLGLFIFLFTYAPRAVVAYILFSGGVRSLNDVLFLHVTWPFSFAFRYITPFIPLFSIFASHGILFFSEKLSDKIKGKSTNLIHKIKTKKNRILKTGVIFAIILVILLQYFYADADLRARADSERKYDIVIDWLRSQGSPVVYAFSPEYKQQYGEDKVVLLTNEDLLDIVKRARHERIEFIISDSLGPYSDAQKTLFWEGFFGREIEPLGYFKLVNSYSVPTMAQIYKISLPTRTALVVQGSASTGGKWVNFLTNTSSPYMVEAVDDEEYLTEYFSGEYDIIVVAEIQRNLENDELSVLREKVQKGTILVMSGLSPAYMNLEENSYWLGARDFVEAPKDAKWNIRFTDDALNILTEIDPNKSYAFYSESLWSSPTGCTGIEPDVIVYAKRVEDGSTTIYVKPYFNGVVIFSGVRHAHASKAVDYGLYVRFLQNMIEGV